jgi:hypothetical protein
MAMNARLLRPLAKFQSPLAFSPLAFSGLQLWLDAATSASMTLNSGNVSAWSDKSLTGNNATQSTALNQPAYVANSVNGLGSVVFDGSDDSLVVPISGLADAETHCFAWVFARLGEGQNDGYSPTIGVLKSFSDDLGALHYIKNDLSAASYPYYSPGRLNYDDFGSYEQDAVEVILFSLRSGDFSVFKNGSYEGGAGFSGAPESEIAGISLATQQNPVRYSNVRLCEVVALFGQSAADEQKLEAYLAHRWGVQSKLPALHPYKDAAP